MRKDIVYDNIIFRLQKFGGISTYWSELAIRLLNDDGFNVKYIDSKHDNLSGRALDLSKGKKIIIDNWPKIISRFSNPKLNSFKSPFIFHSSYNRYSLNPMALNVTTVHDLIHHKFYGGARSWLHNTQKKAALLKSQKIIAVSENTKKDLIAIFPALNHDKIEVIHNGVSPEFYNIRSEDYKYGLSEEILNKKYILFVSSREPYKNFSFVIDVLSELPDCKLYIVGPPIKNEEKEQLNTKLGNNWNSFNAISAKCLNELYNHAHSLIYPSSYEGFGIPLLEAMKAHCPFIALNTSAIPEVAGNAGILINTLDVNQFVKAINDINCNRNEIISKGIIQSDKFSWDKCYRQTVSVYNKLIS